MEHPISLAAVDLGSNSFRLEIGQLENGRFFRSEYLKETVRQGNGLDAQHNLTVDAMQRGWDCLARFGQRLSGFSANMVCAVATQTLREAHNRDAFLEPASRLLGFPITVISGHEEARLIYQGVAQKLPRDDERRLVIDIGGRSTELILGMGSQPGPMASYPLGSIAWSARFFADGLFSPSSFTAAETAATLVLSEALALFPPKSWDVVYGSAGTVNAVVDVLAAAGWPPDCVSRDALNWLQEKLLTARHVDQLRLAGLREDRKPIVAGGLSVLRAVFDTLDISRLERANGGLRHGVLLDLMQRQSSFTSESSQMQTILI